MTLLVCLKTIWETAPFVHFIKSYGGDVHRHCGKWPETVSSVNVLFKGQRVNEGYHVTLVISIKIKLTISEFYPNRPHNCYFMCLTNMTIKLNIIFVY